MSGNITRRGANSWRLKFEACERDAITGKRHAVCDSVRNKESRAARADAAAWRG
jgi:hypothetical protein